MPVAKESVDTLVNRCFRRRKNSLRCLGRKITLQLLQELCPEPYAEAKKAADAQHKQQVEQGLAMSKNKAERRAFRRAQKKAEAKKAAAPAAASAAAASGEADSGAETGAAEPE